MNKLTKSEAIDRLEQVIGQVPMQGHYNRKDFQIEADDSVDIAAFVRDFREMLLKFAYLERDGMADGLYSFVTMTHNSCD